MARLFNGLILGSVVLLVILGRAGAHETEMSGSGEQAMANLSSAQSSGSWDVQKELGSRFSVNPVYQRNDPRGAIMLRDDGIQRDALDFSFKSSLPAGLKGEGQF